jgi:hypothetical protein
MSGTAGMRNRASWCGNRLKRAMPDRADRRVTLRCERRRKKRSGKAGPSSCGRLTRKCWYRGCMPCWARLVDFEL